MLVDDVVISVKAGNGGNGAATFKRNGQTARGGPDGGNGGIGGSVYVIASHDLSDLRQFRYTKKILAEDGIKGGKNNLYGKNAEDTFINVPIGTRITDTATGSSFDIEKDNEKILVAKGGQGGLGNNSFKTSTNQSPHYSEWPVQTHLHAWRPRRTSRSTSQFHRHTFGKGFCGRNDERRVRSQNESGFA